MDYYENSSMWCKTMNTLSNNVRDCNGVIIFKKNLKKYCTVFDLISEHALISEPPLFLKLKKNIYIIFFFKSFFCEILSSL